MARVSRASAPGEAWKRDLKVLIVDDEVFVRTLIKQVINRFGILLTAEAATARAGLERFQPGLAILDINLPGETGLHLLRVIRAGRTPARRDLLVVILTSLGGDVVLSAALELDANAFVSKGEGFRSLEDRVRRAVREPLDLRGAERYGAVALPDSDSLRTAVDGPAAETFDAGLRASVAALVAGSRLPADLLTQAGQLLLTKGAVISAAMARRITDIEETFGLR